MIKAVFFDVGDTLYSQQQAFNGAYKELLEGKYEISRDVLYKRFKYYSDDIYHYYMDGEWTLDEVGIYRIVHTLGDYGLSCTEELALEFQHRYVYYQQYIYLSETTKNMLDALKDRVTLGIITNGNSKRQHGKIQTLGMERWMDEKNIFVSGDLEFAKPDTRIFLLPQNTLGLKAEEMLYIGDSYEHDMQGAKAAGWNTIWMNRRGHDIPEEDCCADRVVPNEEALFQQLCQMLKINSR